jgi:hypothetical protein
MRPLGRVANRIINELRGLNREWHWTVSQGEA